MFNVNNVLHLMIAKNVAETAAPLLVNDYADLTDGEVVITDISGLKLVAGTTALTADKFVLVQRAGTTLIKSPVIEVAKVKATTFKAHADAVEQVSCIGYDGTTATLDIDSIADNTYIARVNRFDSQKTFGNKAMLKYGVYKSLLTTDKLTIAAGLTDSLIKNYSREVEKEIKFERVSSGTSTATSGGTISVVKGSTTVTILGTGADAGKYNADAATIVAGDYIRFGHATTKTYPVYKVASLTGGGASTMVVTLDIPYQGDTTAALAAANAGVIPAATAAAGVVGIKCTGQARNFAVGSFKYSKVRFSLTLQDFGDTTVTDTTAASEGIGTYEQISELEWFAAGFDGAIERLGTPSPTSRNNAILGEEYGIMTISYYDDSVGQPALGGYGATSPKQIIIALDGGVGGSTFGTSVTGGTDGLEEVLNAMFTVNLIP